MDITLAGIFPEFAKMEQASGESSANLLCEAILKVVVNWKNSVLWGGFILAIKNKQKERQIRLNEALSLRKFYEEKYKWEMQCEMLVKRLRLL